MKQGAVKQLATNRKARFIYSILDTLECGIALQGSEVKSMKENRFSFGDAYAKIENSEVWLVNLHISPYPYGNQFNADPDRPRKILVHKQEIKQLKRSVEEKGLTLVPIRFYIRKGIVKLELALCKGKKTYDKREEIKHRDQKRDAERELRSEKYRV